MLPISEESSSASSIAAPQSRSRSGRLVPLGPSRREGARFVKYFRRAPYEITSRRPAPILDRPLSGREMVRLAESVPVVRAKYHLEGDQSPPIERRGGKRRALDCGHSAGRVSKG